MSIINATQCRLLMKIRPQIWMQSQRLIANDKIKPTGETVTLINQTVYFEKIGNGKQHIFFIPGALGSVRTDFSKQLEKLNRDKFTVVALDLPGYGKSRPPDRQFTLDVFHQDAKVAAALLKYLDIPKTNVVGWSAGGAVALILAAQNADLVNKLVVVGAFSFITEEDIQLYEAVRDTSKWSQVMKKPMIDMYGEEYFQKTWNALIDTVTGIYKTNQGEVCRKDLKQIKCPTLVIYGGNDPMVPRFQPITINENISNSRLIEWEDAKHNLHMQYPDKFNETIENFFLNN